MTKEKILPYAPVIANFFLMILAYLYLEWSVYFLFYFYLFDILFFDFFQWRKNIKINHILREVNPYKLLSWIFISLFITGIIEIFVLALALYFSFPDLSFLSEFIKFWTYTELGIQQGYILFPLLFFGSFLRIRQDLMRGIGIKRPLLKAFIKNNFRKLNLFRVIVLLVSFSFSFLPTFFSAFFWILAFSFLSAIKIFFWRKIEQTI